MHLRDVGVLLLGAAHHVHDEDNVRPDDLAAGGLKLAGLPRLGHGVGHEHHHEAERQAQARVVTLGEDGERERAQGLDVAQHQAVCGGAVADGDFVNGRPDVD